VRTRKQPSCEAHSGQWHRHRTHRQRHAPRPREHYRVHRRSPQQRDRHVRDRRRAIRPRGAFSISPPPPKEQSMNRLVKAELLKLRTTRTLYAPSPCRRPRALGSLRPSPPPYQRQRRSPHHRRSAQRVRRRGERRVPHAGHSIITTAGEYRTTRSPPRCSSRHNDANSSRQDHRDRDRRSGNRGHRHRSHPHSSLPWLAAGVHPALLSTDVAGCCSDRPPSWCSSTDRYRPRAICATR